MKAREAHREVIKHHKKEARSLYDSDFYAWTWDQARKLRAGQTIDRELVAEELEDLGRKQQQQLETRLDLLLTHMLKCEFQPDKHTRSWDLTIKEQRRRIQRMLAQMPSLKAVLDESIQEAYAIAVLHASRETEMLEDDFSSECPWTSAEVLGE